MPTGSGVRVPGWCLFLRPMKPHTLILAALAAFLTSTLADTPAAIASDYRANAAAALEKVNATLEKATVPLIADLVKSGDTAAADELKAQLKTKQAGDPVLKPHQRAVSLFALYDAARLRALDPAQKATVARIDALLAGSDGKKLEIVEALGKVRAEVEAGKVQPAPTLAEKWNYHMAADKKPNGVVPFKKDGTLELKIEGRRSPETGTWAIGGRNNFNLVIGEEQFTMTVGKDMAIMNRPIGKRFLTVAPSAP